MYFSCCILVPTSWWNSDCSADAAACESNPGATCTAKGKCMCDGSNPQTAVYNPFDNSCGPGKLVIEYFNMKNLENGSILMAPQMGHILASLDSVAPATDRIQKET